MSKYRIVTNGLYYRVEELRTRGMLWFRRQSWEPCMFYHDSSVPYDYHCLADAQIAIRIIKSEKTAKHVGWKVVEEVTDEQ